MLQELLSLAVEKQKRIIEMKNVLARELPVLDNDFFNQELFAKWYNELYLCTKKVLGQFKKELGNIEGFGYQINPIILREVVYDAIIGLKKIVLSENNEVVRPNPFKISAHLGYWFIRHKPIMFCQWDDDYKLENTRFKDKIEDDQELKLTTIWEVKHINEVVAATFMIRYIFATDKKVVCSNTNLKKLKNTGNFYFEDFNELGNAVIDKLKYHITYRCITPEILEHFLEGYTLHPIWDLTAKLWEADEEE